MPTALWILLVVLYLTALVWLGLATLRKGHTVLFWLGIIVPVLWIFGALMQPTAKAAAADSRSTLQES
jgi:hypothetical protein